MSDAVNAQETPVVIPDDFTEFAAWRANGNKPADAQTDENTPAATDEEATTAGDSGTTDEDQEQDGEGEDEKPPAPKRKGGFQKRIDQLVRENAELRRLAENPAAKPAEAAKPTEQAAGEPQAKDFETYEAYVKALTIYELDQRDQKRAEKERKAAEENKAKEVAQTWQTRAEKVREVHKDFDSVMAEAAEIPVSPVMHEYLLDSERGPEIAYKLAKTPAEAERIAHLSPIAAARELAKIELGLTPVAAPKPKPRVTSAPEPIRPVSRSSAAAKAPLHELDDFSEYQRRRRAGER